MSHGNTQKGWLLGGKGVTTALRVIREKHGLTTYKASNICGLSPGHYSKLENAQSKVTKFTLPKLEKLLDSLGYGDDIKKDVLG